MWARVDIKMTAQSSSSLKPLFGWVNTCLRHWTLKCLQMWVVVQAVNFFNHYYNSTHIIHAKCILDIDIYISTVGLHLSTLWVWFHWRVAWGKKVWTFIESCEFYSFGILSLTFSLCSPLCSCSTENGSASTSSYSDQNRSAFEVSWDFQNQLTEENFLHIAPWFDIAFVFLL